MKIFLLLAFLLVFPSYSYAQNEGKPVSANSVLSAIDDEKKDELVRKLHKYLPSAQLIDNAIDILSPKYAKSEKEKERFQKSMRMLVDYADLEKKSRNYMKETFTVKELEALVEFYSNPNGKSAVEKMKQYQKKIGPEIVKTIDKTLLEYRTGDK